MNEINLTIERNIAQTDESSDFQDRLRRVVELFGSNSALARSIGASETAIRKWVSGASEPKQSAILAIASAADVSIEWLMSGRGRMKSQNDREVESYTQQRPSLLDRYLVKGFNIWVCDDSNMEPTIHEGEICLVQPIESLDKNGIYLIRVEGMDRVQRLQRLPGALFLSNDNPAYRASDFRVELSNPGFPFEAIGRIHRGGKPI